MHHPGRIAPTLLPKRTVLGNSAGRRYGINRRNRLPGRWHALADCARTGYDVVGRRVALAVPEPDRRMAERYGRETSVPDWLLQPGLLTYPPVTLRVALQAGIPRSGGVYCSERGVSPAHLPP